MKTTSVISGLLTAKALLLGIFISTTFAPTTSANAATAVAPPERVCYIVTYTKTTYGTRKGRVFVASGPTKYSQSHQFRTSDTDKAAAATKDANSRYANQAQYGMKNYSNISARVVPCDGDEYKKYITATKISTGLSGGGLFEIEEINPLGLE